MSQGEQDGKSAVLLVGHGAAPKDCPRDLITRLKAMEGRRRATGGEPTAEELELDGRIRNWPRAGNNDPYKAGLEALASRLRPLLSGATLAIAFNEFCAPTVEDAVEDLIARGATRIKIIPSMMTPGGIHSEVEIPEILNALRARHPGVEFQYIWPFDLDRIARLLLDHIHDHKG